MSGQQASSKGERHWFIVSYRTGHSSPAVLLGPFRDADQAKECLPAARELAWSFGSETWFDSYEVEYRAVGAPDYPEQAVLRPLYEQAVERQRAAERARSEGGDRHPLGHAILIPPGRRS